MVGCTLTMRASYRDHQEGLQIKYEGKVSFTINAAGQAYEQTIEFVHFGRGYQRR